MKPVKMITNVEVAVFSYGWSPIYNQLAVRMTPPPIPIKLPTNPAMNALIALVFMNLISF